MKEELEAQSSQGFTPNEITPFIDLDEHVGPYVNLHERTLAEQIAPGVTDVFLDTQQRLSLRFTHNAETGEAEIQFRDTITINSPQEQKLRETISQNLDVVKLDGGLYQVNFGDVVVADVRYDPATDLYDVVSNSRQLGSFDLRQFSHQGDNYLEEWRAVDPRTMYLYRPMLDLHTHYGGQMSTESLVSAAEQSDTQYPMSVLKQFASEDLLALAARCPGREKGNVSMKALLSEASEEQLQEFRESMRVVPGEIIPFTEMEAIYQRRTPLVKDINNFEPLLRDIAKTYQEMGISYAELSVSDIAKPEWLAKAHEVLPQIERETGVRLNFLVGIWRHNITDFNMDMIRQTGELAKQSPYISGVDFMGHETNTSRAFEDQIKAAAAIREEIPHFQVRVHAGENPIFPENVRVAIEAGATRVGHGLYGVDDEVLAMARDKGVIIEFNLDSNKSLNNVDTNGVVDIDEELPVKRYIEKDVRVTLSSDGSGLYGSGGLEETRVAIHAGLTSKDLMHICRSDEQYKASMMESVDVPLGTEVPVPEQFPASEFDHSRWKEVEVARLEHRKALVRSLGEKGIEVVEMDDVQEFFDGRTPILFSGASRSSWPKISPANQEKVTEFIDTLLMKLDPEKVVLVTGATNYGFEKLVHERAQKMGFTVLGTLVEESSADEFEADTITHAVLAGQSWYDKSASAIDMINRNDGIIIFAGGGNILNDEIQAATNVIPAAQGTGAEFFLMDGPEGASTNKAPNFNDTPHRVFTAFDDFADKLRACGQDLL